MKRIFSLAIVVFMVTGCKPDIPAGVLPPARMQAVLWDLMRADEMATFYTTKDSSYSGLDKHEALYQQIFALHNISKKDFTKSLRFYESNPKYLKTVLDSLQQFAEKTQKKTDSIPHSQQPVERDTLPKKKLNLLKKQNKLNQVS